MADTYSFRRSLSDFTVRVRELLADRGVPPHSLTAAEIAASYGEGYSAKETADSHADWYHDNN